jgi:hypothetical protein
MRVFFRKNVRRYAFCCFQNIVFYVLNHYLNSTNPIDKVNFNLIKTKKLLIYFSKRLICNELYETVFILTI